MSIGNKYLNNAGQEFVVLKEFRKKHGNREHTKWIVQFVETGTTKEVYRENATTGKVRDEYAISVYGKGYQGDYSKEENPHWKQARQLWQNMMKRCYSTKDKKGYYGYATVCDRWHCFANFLHDLPKLKNFDLWLNPIDEKYNLDKDLIGNGSVYSPINCQFITEHENKSAGAKATVDQYKRSGNKVWRSPHE